ncbi:NUDIX hydrolase [Pontibaca salina]|uniref:NUDIX hydrolase n=1 Tax=Pontibaca salina TaxID=2795731 RepID=UPI002FCDD0D9
MSTSVTPLLAALAVVQRGDRFLLVRRAHQPDRGLWGFPGGHVEPGETALQAAMRELHEETGLRADPVEYLTNIDVIRHDENGALAVHYLLAAVLCEYRAGTPVAGDDAFDVAWISLETLRAGTLKTSARVAELAELASNRFAQLRRRASLSIETR